MDADPPLSLSEPWSLNQKASLPSPSIERENGAIATLNAGEPALSMCFISKSPSCNCTKEINFTSIPMKGKYPKFSKSFAPKINYKKINSFSFKNTSTDHDFQERKAYNHKIESMMPARQTSITVLEFVVWWNIN